MANGEVTGVCHECETEFPTWELHIVDSEQVLCPSCYIEQCDHPITRKSPSGKEWCIECHGVVEDTAGQTRLDGFTV